MAVVTLLLIVVPRKYESTGMFFVRIGRGGATLDPTTTTSKTVNIQETRESEINSVSDVLQSRGLIEKVVDRVGVETILKTGETEFGKLMDNLPSLPAFHAAKQTDSVADGEDYDTLARRERAVRKILNDIKVKPTRKAATISINCRAATPVLARELVRAMMDEYLSEHIKAHQTDNAYDFFEEQFALQKVKVEEITDAIRDFKNRAGITNIHREHESIQQQIDTLDLMAIDTDSQLAAAQTKLKILEQQFGELDDRLVTQQVDGNSHEGSDLMRDRLFALQILEKELLSKFSPDHPEVAMVRQQLAKARSVFVEQPEDRTTTTKSVNPIKLDVEGSLLKAIADHRGVEAKKRALFVKKQNLQDRLKLMNRNEATLAAMTRQLDVAQRNYGTYAEKLEEARINRELDIERISNVKIVEEPTLVLKAVSPKRMFIFALSLLVSAVAGVGLAQLLDAADTTIRSSNEIATNLPVPILAELPRTPSRRVMSSST